MRTVLFLPFTEPDGVAPSDRLGTLADLAITTGLARPSRATDPTWAGGGHLYVAASLEGWVAADEADGDSLLQRDVTIQALLSFDATLAAGTAATVICRGLDGSTAEYYGWGLELCEQSGNAGYVEVRWIWQSSAGVLATVLPGVYQHPGDTAELLITATRRWVSTTEVVCRYYVNADMVAEVTSTSGDISGGTTGHTSVGARKTSGTWGRPYSGVIDQLKVTDYEMSAEEVRAVWDRMTLHQPNGVLALRALEPPGVPWSRDPSSDVGKLLAVAGQAVGYAAARAEELRQNGLPHRAYADTIGRWEQLVGLAQNDRIALDTRRARVVTQLSRENGYSPTKIQDVMADPFDLSAAQVEILEFSPTIEDGFATLEDERWYAEPAGVWSIVAGTLQLSRLLGDDLRFEPGAYAPCHVRTPAANTTDMIVQVKLATYWAALPAETIVGLFLHNRRTNDALWFGIKDDAGVRTLGWVQLKTGVMSAFTPLVAPSTDAAYYLRVTKGAASGDYTLAWSTIGFNSMSSALIVGTGMADPENVGVGAMSTDVALSTALTATFDDFLCRSPQSTRAFHWYCFRDPLLPGSPDMIGANTVVRTLKPAHTHGYAISSRSMLCDDDGSVCDGGPMGGL